MKSNRNALIALAVLVPICAGVLTYRLVALRDMPLSRLEIFAIAVPPLMFLTCLPILLGRRFLGPRKRLSQTITATDRALLFGGMLLGNALIFIGVSTRRWWLSIIGVLIIPLVSMLRGSPREKGMQRGQFSLRRMFFMVTVCAVLIGVMLAIQRWHEAAQHQIDEQSLQRRRAIWENDRGKLPPGVYEQKMKELDDEAAKRGL
jgi:hypothetical protein